jgi:hypothetical protein
MKKIVFALLLMGVGSAAFAQNKLDKIIEKTIETMGGKEKLMTIKSIKKMGFGEGQGVKYPVSYYAVDNKAERTDFSFNGLTGYQIITVDSGFNFNPFAGMATPERMTDADVKLSVDEFDLETPLVNYQAKGHTIELMENEDIDGVDAVQLRATLKNGKTIFYYIDPDTYYIIRTTVKGVSNGQEFSNTSNYYNFKKTTEGLVFPFTINEISYDSIELNVSLDEKLFSTKK